MSTWLDLPSSVVDRGILCNPLDQGNWGGESTVRGRGLTAKIVAPWADWVDTLQVIEGLPETIGGVLRKVPLECPWLAGMWATSATWSGHGASDAPAPDPGSGPVDWTLAAPFTHVVFEVRFETPVFPFDGDEAFTSVRVVGSADKVTVPGNFWKYVDTDGDPLDMNLGVDVGKIAIETTRHWVPSPSAAFGVMVPLMSRVNSHAVVLGGYTFDPGFLYFPSFQISSVLGGGNTIQTSVTYPLVYRSLSWQQVIGTSGTAVDVFPAPYLAGDLNALLGI